MNKEETDVRVYRGLSSLGVAVAMRVVSSLSYYNLRQSVASSDQVSADLSSVAGVCNLKFGMNCSWIEFCCGCSCLLKVILPKINSI
jgi:hypothetical protein